MRRLLASASIVLLAVLTVPSTVAGASAPSRTRPFAGFGTATLVVTDVDTGTFVIDGREITLPLGPLHFHSDGVFTGPDTFSLATTLTARDGSTFTTTTTGTTTTLSSGDSRFKNQDTVTGGTGRFTGATGSTTTVGISRPDAHDPLVSHIVFVFAGKIT